MKVSSWATGLSLLTGVLSSLTADELATSKLPSNVIEINESNFDSILTGPRDYYTALLFTALDDSVGCAPCKKFEPVYHKIARSYQDSNPGKNDILFFKADFSNNQKKFIDLQMLQVPHLWVYPPSTELAYNVTSPHFEYKIGDHSSKDPLHYANFVSKLVNANIVVHEDFDLTQFSKYFFTTFFAVLVLKKKVLSKLASRLIFCLISILTIVVFTSGYMFTVIRNIPLLSKNEKGEIMYFSGGTHWQFGSEVFIIGGIYLGFVFLINGLVVVIPKIDNPAKRNTLTLCACFFVFWLFNRLTSIYKIKDPSYPYQVASWL